MFPLSPVKTEVNKGKHLVEAYAKVLVTSAYTGHIKKVKCLSNLCSKHYIGTFYDEIMTVIKFFIFLVSSILKTATPPQKNFGFLICQGYFWEVLGGFWRYR